MRLHRLAYGEADGDQQTYSWHASRDAASKARTAVKEKHKGSAAELETELTEIEVPTNKSGLLAFLNKNLSHS